ncbi:MAG: nickel pincer cofactor biosynthesis protein LarC [Halobacteria archaeon]|nr:nickel pincer cofactor biosynthesis protein LarC [Halobacteria archaeon]
MLVFDASSGASGDMVLGALVDAGADADLLEKVEDVVPVSIEFERVDKAGVNAQKVNVVGGGDDDGDGHGHSHAHRSYTEVVGIVENSDLPTPVVDDALAVFELIAEAEAEVHDVSLDELDFHEVGADDAIADVLGASLLFDDLDEDVVTGTINVGGGTVEAAHGEMPVPVPAVTEILKESEHAIEGGPVESELLTPTGAALLVHFTEPVERLPALEIEGTGYGAGRKEFDHPNVLRVLRGSEVDSRRMPTKGIEVLETNVDDVSGEILGSLYEVLRDEGARDVAIIPIQMKKNRPGHIVQVIARSEDAEHLARVLAEETGTLGVRATPYTHRFVAEREIQTVEVEIAGEVFEADVKIASVDDEVFDVSAEFDDARRIAEETNETLRDVMRLVEEEWQG